MKLTIFTRTTIATAVLLVSTCSLATEIPKSDSEAKNTVQTAFFNSIKPIQNVADDAEKYQLLATETRKQAVQFFGTTLKNVDYLSNQVANMGEYIQQATNDELTLEINTIKSQIELFNELAASADCKTGEGCPRLSSEISRLKKLNDELLSKIKPTSLVSTENSNDQ